MAADGFGLRLIGFFLRVFAFADFAIVPLLK
jgi:hypothetical protein